MNKRMLCILTALLILLMLSGCNSELETKISHLDEQLTLLQDRVSALETENALLRLQLENVNTAVPKVPAEPEDRIPTAELYFSDWSAEEGLLTIDGAFARVMALGADARIADCMLILYHNGEEVEAIPLTLLPGEATDSFELELDPLSYDLPELKDGDTLELELSVSITTGTNLTALGGSWDYADNQLIMIAG